MICAHCGLVATAGEAREVSGAVYCCAGCVTAAAIIRASGLGGFYALPERREARVEPSGRTFAEFDHEAFQSEHVRRTVDGLAEVSLYLEGVHCASCVWLVERVPFAVQGAVRAELDVTRGLARISWDPARTTLSAIARCLDALGYRPHPFRGHAAAEARRGEERAMLANIGVAAALAANLMAVALALYSGVFDGIEREFERYFRWVSLVLVTPALVWPGRVFFRSAWTSLRAGGLNMDVPIALALGAGYVQGAVNTVGDSGQVYFDAVATLIFLLLVGRYLQYRAQRAAADAATLLGALSPAMARMVDGDAVREIPIEAVTPGMTLEVRAGDTLGADGEVTSGASALDLALLTGEARPVQVSAGDAVFAGTVNLSSPFRMRVVEAGQSSRLGRLLRDVEEGARGRPPIVLLADRIAGYFVAVVLVLAAGTLAFWWSRDAAAAVDHAIALLVVTCPCALAMATPLAFTAAIGRAARRGILVKGGHALETLARPGTLLVDKTGTLTGGRLTLQEWTGDDATRGLVASLERNSRHPVALAFVDAWPDAPTFPATDVVEVLGSGIEGRVNGASVIVGTASWVAMRIGARRDDAASGTRTSVAVAVNGRLVATAAFGDPVRPEARSVVHELVRRGWDVRIVSGDAPEVVAAVATELGLEPDRSLGGVTPEQKRDVVRAAQRELGPSVPVVMVGDGVNDAAAISTATAGIAVRGGAEAAMAAADVYLGRVGIGALPELLEGARGTTRLVRRLSVAALAYNAVGVTLAVTGMITPLLAAILMPVSSVSVVLGAWRGRTFPRQAA